jgi:hypothetical protein
MTTTSFGTSATSVDELRGAPVGTAATMVDRTTNAVDATTDAAQVHANTSLWKCMCCLHWR